MVWPASESPFSARQNADGRLVEKARPRETGEDA